MTGISSVVNPEKLTHLGQVADSASLLRTAVKGHAPAGRGR